MRALDCGTDIVGVLSDDWSRFAVVTTPTPWRGLRQSLRHQPDRVLCVGNLEITHLDTLASAADGIDLVVGLGSGRAMDAAKYVALKRSARLILVPTNVSNAACLNPFIGAQHQGIRQTIRESPDPERVIIDYSVIQSAPGRLNRGGMAEVLCQYTGIADWKVASTRGIGPTYEPVLALGSKTLADRVVAVAEEIRAVSVTGIRTLVETWRDMGIAFVIHGHDRFGGGSEHLFAWRLAQLSDTPLFHAEAVAMGVVVIGYLQGTDFTQYVDALERAGTPYHTGSVGVSWDSVRQTLTTLRRYAEMSAVELPHTIVNEVEVTPAMLADLRALLDRKTSN